MLCGSNWICFTFLDVRQDEVQQRRSGLGPDVALQVGERGLAARDQLGDDGRIGFDRGGACPRRRPSRAFARPRRNEVASVEDGLERVADERIRFSQGAEETGPARRRSQQLGDVHEQPPAGLTHGTRSRQLPDGEPQGLDRVGHHLLMTDGDVDVVLLVAGGGDGKQRRDRPALNDLKVVVDQAPFDVLRTAEVRFDPPAELREPHDLRIRQRRLLLPLRIDRMFLRPACRRSVGSPGAWWRPPWRRSRRRAPCKRPRSPSRRPAPRRDRSWPRPRRPSGCP